jgi:hypothetical protein
MSYRRRLGRRMTSRKKVSRAELVMFTQKAEKLKATRRAERLARVMIVLLWGFGFAMFGLAVYYAVTT